MLQLLKNIRLPKQISPCPIKEAVVEIRFDSALPADATFGVVYNSLKTSYQQVEQLPILQIPEFVRANDSNLTFQPYYRLRSNRFALQIGPKVISLAVSEPYPGWGAYLSEIKSVFEKLRSLEFITTVSRFGIRYIDFFEDDIFKNINLSVTINGESATTDQTFIRTVIDRGKLQSLLQVGNQMSWQQADVVVKVGSVLDIDTFTLESGNNFFENIESLLREAHDAQKVIFFGLLKPEFLATLNPVY